ncbi:ATP-binding cassette sub-family A member 1, partial [Trichonephila clavata]
NSCLPKQYPSSLDLHPGVQHCSWLEAPSCSRSLLHLVELVGNVTECISLDRFIGFDTEEELEAAAATLHDRREFSWRILRYHHIFIPYVYSSGDLIASVK